jgi:hypothetical protein
MSTKEVAVALHFMQRAMGKGVMEKVRTFLPLGKGVGGMLIGNANDIRFYYTA